QDIISNNAEKKRYFIEHKLTIYECFGSGVQY
ncbi:MAG: hypothetical protein K0Q66_1825, partial [Chitinophagaceae bacterium]|nr:hypothetical protein [Chitinophagaceae bacterium]